jgi:hypothetical protein
VDKHDKLLHTTATAPAPPSLRRWPLAAFPGRAPAPSAACLVAPLVAVTTRTGICAPPIADAALRLCPIINPVPLAWPSRLSFVWPPVRCFGLLCAAVHARLVLARGR